MPLAGLKTLPGKRLLSACLFRNLKSLTSLGGSRVHAGLVRFQSTDTNDMDLSKVVQRLNKLASPSLAGSWDNVGLLVEPSPPHLVRKILLTNDLTPPVLEEAIAEKSDMVISYHPPIFSPLKRLTQKKWKEEIIVKCIEHRIAVYSPHTSHDCVEGGVNDWLISCFDTQVVKPVEQHLEFATQYSHKVTFDLPTSKVEDITRQLKDVPQVSVPVCSNLSESTSHISIFCVTPALLQVMEIIQGNKTVIQNLESLALAQTPKPGYGMGRKATLSSGISVDEAVDIVKKHLKLERVRLARAPGNSLVSSVAVCAGSGGSVLRNVTADLYVTGEMSHHDVLHAVFNGTSIILCDHSNTERGYLSVLQARLKEILDSKSVEIHVSQTDCDPLYIV